MDWGQDSSQLWERLIKGNMGKNWFHKLHGKLAMLILLIAWERLCTFISLLLPCWFFFFLLWFTWMKTAKFPSLFNLFFFPLSLPKPFLQVMLTVSFLTEWLKNTVWWYTNWDECPDTWKNQVWNRVSVTTWEECLYAHQVLIRSHTNWYSIYLWELLCL